MPFLMQTVARYFDFCQYGLLSLVNYLKIWNPSVEDFHISDGVTVKMKKWPGPNNKEKLIEKVSI